MHDGLVADSWLDSGFYSDSLLQAASCSMELRVKHSVMLDAVLDLGLDSDSGLHSWSY